MSQIDEYMKLLRERYVEEQRALAAGREAVKRARAEAPYPVEMSAFINEFTRIASHEQMFSTTGVAPETETAVKQHLVALRRGLIDGFMERIRPIDDSAQEPAQDSAVGEQLELPLIQPSGDNA